MHNFKNLLVWQKAREFVKILYEVTSYFPVEEKYGIISQLRRASISIPSNISEGSGRNSELEFIRFLHIAYSSSYEIETQIFLSFDLGFIEKEKLDALLDKLYEIQKMLFILIKNKSKKI